MAMFPTQLKFFKEVIGSKIEPNTITDDKYIEFFKELLDYCKDKDREIKLDQILIKIVKLDDGENKMALEVTSTLYLDIYEATVYATLKDDDITITQASYINMMVFKNLLLLVYQKFHREILKEKIGSK